MVVIESVKGIREEVRSRRNLGQVITFVPTMGNLHRGHTALIRTAKQYGGTVLVSLYVNPLQFGANEDFSTYPRTLETDKLVLLEEQVDVLFLPDDHTIYPHGVDGQTKVEVPHLGKILEGVTRPDFFRGVTTVVNRLFNIVLADIAIFGKKDYQQWIVIKRMVDDLAMPIEIIGVETVRDQDGLALSSRNSYLTAEQRRVAPTLYRALRHAADSLNSGEREYARIERRAFDELRHSGLKPDYISVRSRQDLTLPDKNEKAWVVLGAAYVGATRLIDNIEVGL